MKYPCLSNHLQEISEKKPEISDYADESRFHRFVMMTQIISKITNQSQKASKMTKDIGLITICTNFFLGS